MSRTPAVSVLLPVRNARPWLAASLASLRRQDFRDFEVVAVDDGSTDGSGEQLERAARAEPRLRVVRSAQIGLPAALNLAFAHARAPLLARHDADDLSHRRRFALQTAYMRGHDDVAVAGSRLRLFPASSVGAGMRRWADWHNALMTHEAMAAEVLIDSPLCHGTAMIRRTWLERAGGWSERGWAEDLDLWIRLLESGARFAKLGEVLYGWRQHRASATRRDPRYRRERFVALKLDALDRGLLRAAPAMTLVGVGESLERARGAFAASRAVASVEARRPSDRVIAALQPPIVLVFGAYIVRRRWRVALSAAGLVERRDFCFAT